MRPVRLAGRQAGKTLLPPLSDRSMVLVLLPAAEPELVSSLPPSGSRPQHRVVTRHVRNCVGKKGETVRDEGRELSDLPHLKDMRVSVG